MIIVQTIKTWNYGSFLKHYCTDVLDCFPFLCSYELYILTTNT